MFCLKNPHHEKGKSGKSEKSALFTKLIKESLRSVTRIGYSVKLHSVYKGTSVLASFQS